MNETLQTIIALAAVGLAVGWLGWRAFARRGASGCGSSGCACATGGLKIVPRLLPPAGPPPNK
jgi:hypothetical protein